jgi:hypothetical protein
MPSLDEIGLVFRAEATKGMKHAGVKICLEQELPKKRKRKRNALFD